MLWASGPSLGKALTSGCKADSPGVVSALRCHLIPRKSLQGFRCPSIAFPEPSKAFSHHAHTCHVLPGPSPSLAPLCQAGAGVFFVPVIPCCDLFPHQCSPIRWGFLEPESQPAHLCTFINVTLAIRGADVRPVSAQGRCWIGLECSETPMALSLLVEFVSQHSQAQARGACSGYSVPQCRWEAGAHPAYPSSPFDPVVVCLSPPLSSEPSGAMGRCHTTREECHPALP